jgi:hypothetical protein
LLARHPEVEAVFTDLEKRHGDRVCPSFMRQTAGCSRRLRGAGYPDGLVLEPREMRLCLLEEVPIKPSVLRVRRRVFEQVGGFDETWSPAPSPSGALQPPRRSRDAGRDPGAALISRRWWDRPCVPPGPRSAARAHAGARGR